MTKNKRFLLSALAFSVALAVVSCKPLTGCAVEIDAGEQFGIQNYLSTAGENLNAIDFRFDSDEDGNRSIRLKIFALQQAALQTQSGIYDNMDFSVAPSTVSISGGGGITGLYKYNSKTYPVTVSTYAETSGIPPLLVDAPHFTWKIVPPSGTAGKLSSESKYWAYNSRVSVNIDYAGDCKIVGTGLLPTVSYYPNYTSGYYFDVKFQNFIPDWTGSTIRYDYGSHLAVVGGFPQQVSLPSASYDTDKPWNYYNNTLLPYLQQNYPAYTDYFIFPDGYEPPSQPTTVPVEYPTLPGFDFALETNGTEPASSYNYNAPDLPGKDIAVPSFDFTQINPAEIMAPVANGLTGLWSLITGVLTEYNLFPFVAIAVLAAIVAGLMHLGK